MPCRLDPTGLVIPLNQCSTSLVNEGSMIEELVQLEHSIWDLRDAPNALNELPPFGQLNVKFELAFFHPELVSRRYPVGDLIQAHELILFLDELHRREYIGFC